MVPMFKSDDWRMYLSCPCWDKYTRVQLATVLVLPSVVEKLVAEAEAVPKGLHREAGFLLGQENAEVVVSPACRMLWVSAQHHGPVAAGDGVTVDGG